MCRPPRTLVGTLLLLVLGCGSSSTPAAPTVTTPILAPSPPPTGTPVSALNRIFVPLPAPPPPSADPLVGRYALDVVIEPAAAERCETVPAHAKRRTYSADVLNHGNGYVVRLYEATFLADISPGNGIGCADLRLPGTGICNQFLMTPAGGSTLSVTMSNDDDRRGAQIWEVLTQEDRLLEIGGNANAVAQNGKIEATGSGGLWWGNGLPATDSAVCLGDIRLSFTPF